MVAASPAPSPSTASAATSAAETAVSLSHLERTKLGLLHDILALTRSVRTRDPRPTARVLRSLNVVRRRLQPHAKLAALESILMADTPATGATNAKASAASAPTSAPAPAPAPSSSSSSSSSSSATDAAAAPAALPDSTKEQGFAALVFVLQLVVGKPLSAAASVMSDVDEHSAAYTTPTALARLTQAAFAKTASVAALLRLGTDEYEKAVQQASTDADGEQTDATGAEATGADLVVDAVRHVREAVAQEVVPEVLLYLDLLYALYALDSEGVADDEACTVLSSLVHVLATQVNRRTADTLSAKVYHFYALAHERWSRCTDPTRASPLGARVYSSIRPTLLLAHRTACLQHNDPACSVLITSILRSYLHDDLYAQADSFRLKASFPETRESASASSSSSSASSSSSGARTNAKSASGLESSSQLARYLYYTGRIQALQLQYSDAYASLLHALRKAPQSVRVARGFRSQVTKLFIIVQLLMGDIPERSVFAAPDLAADLMPYLALTRAVRVGDLSLFERAQAQYASAFAADRLSSLIVRLRHHVIKTALRQVNLSYSQVRLGDLAVKLKLSSVADAEAILVKAIHDHVVDAVVTPVATGAASDASALDADLASSIVASEVAPPLYTTTAPQEAFDRRIQFTMEVRNEAVRALRFPDNSHKTINEILEEEEEDDDLSMSSRKRDKEQRKDVSSKDGKKDPPAKK